MTNTEYLTVRYDLSTALVDEAIRSKLIELGWTPPEPKNTATTQKEQAFEEALESAYWYFDARKNGLNEWTSYPQSERDAFKAEARKLVKGYFQTGSPEAQQEPVAWRIRRIDPVRDWTLMYSRPITEEQFSNIEVQPLYAHPPRLETEQEPMAWMLPGTNSIIMAATKVYKGVLAKDYTQPLYTHPPLREWIGLTADDVWASDKIMAVNASLGLRIEQMIDLIRAVEDALKEKNA